MQQTSTYESFQWLDFEKLQNDPTSLMDELGLEAFPSVVPILQFSIAIIYVERDRQSAIGLNSPYLCNATTDLSALRDMAEMLNSRAMGTLQTLKMELMRVAVSKGTLSVARMLTDQKTSLSPQGLPKLRWPWNIDAADMMALRVLWNLDLSYQQYQGGCFD